jgi:ubiquinone/menaquinone biosynthesis C-methylase UbiE
MIESAKPHNSHVCPHKFAFMLDNWIRRLIQNPGKILNGYINQGDIAMDVGCGPGFFTIDMAKMVGPDGRVIAVDLQPEMLASTLKKAVRKGVTGRVVAHQCAADRIGFDEQVDFILAYYMVHETPDPPAFFKEAQAMLKEGGRLLVVEPRMHVSKKAFEAMVRVAEQAGFKAADFPGKKGGYGALFTV